jgi:uncharacterized protein YdaU (DUF1376 family)
VANLTWFQYDIAVWEAKTRELGLSLEEEGILMRLIRAAWQSPVLGTIADTDDEFARILGAKWKHGLPLIRRMFTVGEDGRLRCALFEELYERAETKHQSYVDRGSKGGRPRKPEKKPQLPKQKPQLSIEGGSGSGNESSGSDPLARKNTAEGNTCAPSEHTSITPASVAALGPAGPRGSPTPISDISGVIPGFDWRGEILARNGGVPIGFRTPLRAPDRSDGAS